MPKIIITSLHKGMDLKDVALDVKPGFTGISVGCDFGQPGVVTPMASDLLIQTFTPGALDIDWARIVYIQDVAYQFTTHADGLRVTVAGAVTVIDSAFTGTFCCLVINDQYVVFSNGTINRKWAPGWASTDQWGVNTAPMPTLSLGALTTKTIDSLQATTGWTAGSGATVALDGVTTPPAGSASVKLSGSANTTVAMSKLISIDLSKFTTSGDLGTASIQFWFYCPNLVAVTALHLMIDCSSAANFTTDWYQTDITINNVASQALGYGSGGASWGNLLAELVAAQQQSANNPALASGAANVDNEQVTVSSGKWVQFQIKVSDFIRTGSNASYDWSTISAARFQLDLGQIAGSIDVNDLQLVGGGNPYGTYYFAVAYEDVFGNYGPYSAYTPAITSYGAPIILSGMTPDTDIHTTKRRLAVVGGSITEPMVVLTGDNTSTTYTYNTEDAALSTSEIYFYEDPPPACASMVLAGGRIFMVSGPYLYYSDPFMFEGFPAGNYLMFPSENLVQADILQNQYVAARGYKEHLVQLVSSDPTQWQAMDGAKFGAESSNFLMDLGGGSHVWAANGRFWQSGDTEYLPEIGYVVSDFSKVFGFQAGLFTYLYFKDTSGADWILRIDYRMGTPIAHYVEGLAPSCIFGDPKTLAIYYALGNQIFQFAAGASVLPALLTIPEQFDGKATLKDWQAVQYDLSGGPIGMTLLSERNPFGGAFGQGTPGQGVYGEGGYTLPNATIDGDAVSLPMKSSVSLGLQLSSTTQNWKLTLPFKIEYEDSGD